MKNAIRENCGNTMKQIQEKTPYARIIGKIIASTIKKIREALLGNDETREKCSKIIEKLLKEAPFAEIKDKKIHIITKIDKKYRDFNAFAPWIPFVVRYIAVNQNFDFDDEERLKAVLAHELGHHEQYAELGLEKYMTLIYRLIFRPKNYDAIKKYVEHYADKKTIEVGCATGLYKRAVSKNQNPRRTDLEFYMSPDEIEEYAKKKEKWDENAKD
jgi:hypothetical protein